MTALARHVPDELRGGRIRPLGIDRYGLRLRVEHPGDLGAADPFTTGDTGAVDHDVRLAFDEPVDCRQRLGVALRKLVGCPMRPQA